MVAKCSELVQWSVNWRLNKNTSIWKITLNIDFIFMVTSIIVMDGRQFKDLWKSAEKVRVALKCVFLILWSIKIGVWENRRWSLVSKKPSTFAILVGNNVQITYLPLFHYFNLFFWDLRLFYWNSSFKIGSRQFFEEFWLFSILKTVKIIFSPYRTWKVDINLWYKSFYEQPKMSFQHLPISDFEGAISIERERKPETLEFEVEVVEQNNYSWGIVWGDKSHSSQSTLFSASINFCPPPFYFKFWDFSLFPMGKINLFLTEKQIC